MRPLHHCALHKYLRNSDEHFDSRGSNFSWIQTLHSLGPTEFKHESMFGVSFRQSQHNVVNKMPLSFKILLQKMTVSKGERSLACTAKKSLVKFAMTKFYFSSIKLITTCTDSEGEAKNLMKRNSSRPCLHQKIWVSRPWHFGGWCGHHHATCSIDCGPPSLSLCLGIRVGLWCCEPKAFALLHHLPLQDRMNSLSLCVLEQWCPLSVIES